MNAITENTVNDIVKTIIDAVNPIKIVLFGSYVRGNAGVNSDLDFLIVKEKPFSLSRSRRKEIGDIHRSLKRFPIPMDILVYSNNEFEKYRSSKRHIVAHALEKGRILYERH